MYTDGNPQGRILQVGGPGANIEDGSSLIIHWCSGLHKRSTNWANQYLFGGAPIDGGPGAMAPWTPRKSGPGRPIV